MNFYSGRWIALNDKRNHLGAWLDNHELKFYDQNNKVRIRLGPSTGLTLYDSEGNERVLLGSEAVPNLTLFDGQKRMKAIFGLDDQCNSSLSLLDKDGKLVQHIGN